MKFRGHAHRSLDPKGRIILPPEFRDQIFAEVQDGRIVLTIFEGHVIGITPAQWDKLEAELQKKSKNPSRQLRDFMRILYSGYEEVQVDSQGRMQLPAHLRKSGKLNKEVVLLGVGDRFEIWGEESYQSLLEQDYSDVSDELSDAGVILPF
ncbi:MAG TPA: division/cell wall cluster transcriptional repressor MraZ [Desulfovibrio sp.]|jgi:MraZ protein|uniref:division/cell wall cluster transcriptional repressor MraZ n=1 Tax=Desulfovibrio TaxID=872 RepID=UPI000417CDC1|nr:MULTISPECIES: division/cell wall cluster transcriptional repressor MraZ [Desulfovibrio]MDY0307098.1 division/cell wall cluster transcriptional repressor MraZ [Desulfovibrionaceae bacterium]HMM39528.1 division/cell wall cluster transcriptional repressor MraZ [Desulfovibrio sp.]